MRRTLMLAGAWTGATGAAITLSWFGVSTVLTDAVHAPPGALPLSDSVAEPDASSTQRPPSIPPATDESATPLEGGEGATDGAGGAANEDAPAVGRGGHNPDGGPADGTRSTEAETSAGLGTVETVPTDGGRVAFDIGENTAALVSAAPRPGWEMQVREDESRIRVTFSRGDRLLSVFCTYDGHEPVIDISDDQTPHGAPGRQ